ncbi:MAG: hypothetical protein FLDDKLPJ_03015 [Phycisphaerae bacterium]|nr:hypothetical protein [Phycisphaerae bacterium]
MKRLRRVERVAMGWKSCTGSNGLRRVERVAPDETVAPRGATPSGLGALVFVFRGLRPRLFMLIPFGDRRRNPRRSDVIFSGGWRRIPRRGITWIAVGETHGGVRDPNATPEGSNQPGWIARCNPYLLDNCHIAGVEDRAVPVSQGRSPAATYPGLEAATPLGSKKRDAPCRLRGGPRNVARRAAFEAGRGSSRAAAHRSQVGTQKNASLRARLG